MLKDFNEYLQFCVIFIFVSLGFLIFKYEGGSRYANDVQHHNHLISRNFKPVRELTSLKEVQRKYGEKYLNQIYDQDIIHFSRIFFNTLEFVFAEIIIHYCSIISNTKDDYIKLNVTKKIEILFNMYLDMFNLDQINEIILSLQVRIIRNISNTEIDLYEIYSTVYQVFKTSLKNPMTSEIIQLSKNFDFDVTNIEIFNSNFQKFSRVILKLKN